MSFDRAEGIRDGPVRSDEVGLEVLLDVRPQLRLQEPSDDVGRNTFCEFLQEIFLYGLVDDDRKYRATTRASPIPSSSF